jgi:hypothetical protein
MRATYIFRLVSKRLDGEVRGCAGRSWGEPALTPSCLHNPSVMVHPCLSFQQVNEVFKQFREYGPAVMTLTSRLKAIGSRASTRGRCCWWKIREMFPLSDPDRWASFSREAISNSPIRSRNQVKLCSVQQRLVKSAQGKAKAAESLLIS